MAWPCISRVCCLARFWSQLDRSDLSVPLSTQSYSAISEPEPEPEHRAPRSGRAPAADQRTSRAGRDAVFEARDECRPPGGPFHCVTRYKEDFQPWPVPRKETFPWIGEGRRHERLPEGPQYPGDSAQEPGGTGARSTNAYGYEGEGRQGGRSCDGHNSTGHLLTSRSTHLNTYTLGHQHTWMTSTHLDTHAPARHMSLSRQVIRWRKCVNCVLRQLKLKFQIIL
uniref:MAP6 domain containing 1 n=1 Tax=Scleropages formosus TaxID=113540 RepID=A0A8C9WRR6_SCLFO